MSLSLMPSEDVDEEVDDEEEEEEDDEESSLVSVS
jgi:hypothetical protein